MSEIDEFCPTIQAYPHGRLTLATSFSSVILPAKELIFMLCAFNSLIQ